MTVRILIVDDEENLVLLAQTGSAVPVPRRLAWIRPISGEEGLSRLAVNAYDLIIADYRMPGFSGLELIKGVRYLDPRTPIILMTAYGSEELWPRGEVDWAWRTTFGKPFDMDEMLSGGRPAHPRLEVT